MTFKTDDRVYETSVTTGTGDYTLDGAVVGFTTFAGMGANNLCPYFATDDTNWEVGIGTILTGPARLQRTAVLRSSNADAAVNWAAGTRKLRCGLPAAMAVPRSLSKSVAGGVDVALTQDEQRRRVLIFTGALTGSINVTVDATVWDWIVYNNTSGAYTLKLKTTGGAGVFIAQGGRAVLACDGVDVVDPVPTPAYGRVVRTAGNLTTSSTSLVDITGASVTLATGANPVAVGFQGSSYIDTAAANMYVNIDIDGSLQLGTAGKLFTQPIVNEYMPHECSIQSAALTAGSHTIKAQWSVSSGTGTITAGSSIPYMFWAREIR